MSGRVRGVERGRPASTSSNIDAWLARALKKPGVLSVSLTYEALSGSEEVEQWTLDELSDSAGAHIFEAAQAHAEDLGAVGRYTVRLHGQEGGILSAKQVRVVPLDSDDLPMAATEVDDASVAGVLNQVLRHQEIMMRMHSTALSSVLSRMHDLLKMEAGENDLLRRRLRVAQRDREEDPEAEADAAERSAAMDRMVNAVTEHVIPALVGRVVAPGEDPH